MSCNHTRTRTDCGSCSCRELIWAVYAVIEAMSTYTDPETKALAAGWTTYLNYLKTTAAKVSF